MTGKFETYTYDSSHRMLTVQDKRDNLMVTNVYDVNGRVAQQTYADGGTNLFAYTLDGNPANLNPLRTAMEKGDYRWAAQLGNHLDFAEPENKEVRDENRTWQA